MSGVSGEGLTIPSSACPQCCDISIVESRLEPLLQSDAARSRLKQLLLWFVDPDGGGLLDWIDPPNREVYENCVLNDPGHPLEQRPDPVGIVPLP